MVYTCEDLPEVIKKIKKRARKLMHGKVGRDDWRDNLRDSCSGFVMHMPLNLISRTTSSRKRPRKEKNSIKFIKNIKPVLASNPKAKCVSFLTQRCIKSHQGGSE